MTYVFHEDPGHGWLQVQASELFALGIHEQITTYSYIHAGSAYLEEDCDLSTFFRAKEAAGQPLAWEEIRKVYHQHDAPIRSMPAYYPSYAEFAAPAGR